MPTQPTPPADPGQTEPPPEPATRVMSIWGNDAYRCERVKRLIESAAQTESETLTEIKAEASAGESSGGA